MKTALALSFFAALVAQWQAIAEDPSISLAARDAHGWIHVRGSQTTNELITLRASSNLIDWQVIAILHGNSFEFADPATSVLTQRFYKFDAAPLIATNDWKNQVRKPVEPFLRFQGAAQPWVKFSILTDDPRRVYYADSSRYTFHYDFATTRLEPFLGMTQEEFEQVSFFNQGRRAVLGTVLFPNYPRSEYGIQFVSSDPLPRELVRDLFELVKSTVIPDPLEPDLRAFYLPTFEQAGVAQVEAAYFASNGVPVSSVERWGGGETCYSGGWALGTLKFFRATNVVAAYAEGRLTPQDILLTDGIPAELPYVSGIITLTPTTANSHVVILAQSYGVPFAFIADEIERARVLQLTNREIAYQVGTLNSICSTLIMPIDPPLEPAVRTNLMALRAGPAFQIVPTQSYGAYTAPTDNLVPADIRFFGGKAANYGLLRRVIPSNSQPAIAISFDLWNEFMDQALGNGQTLRQEISNRLAGFTYPPNVGALQTELAAIRTLIRNSTQFTTVQEQAITNALSVFDRRRNIRFRSSTNVEDAESFSGAGLYDSFSGCLADDQDADTSGPSGCDPTEDDERGVFRAIRRVFASFYNNNACLERLRLDVDENRVGMALLVHHSTPDDIELANGVATGRWSRESHTFDGTMISQLGAVSVANPDGTAAPETVQFDTRTNRAPRVDLLQSSSLVRLGETVMNWDQDFLDMSGLLLQVAEGYGAIITNKSPLHLDLEYKKVSPATLEIKQVREIPQTTHRPVAPLILNNSEQVFANWHGFYDDIWMAHRLKSRWTLRHRSVQFTPAELAQGFYREMTIEHLDGTNVQTLSGPVGSFSNYLHETFANPFNSLGTITDHWTMGTGSGAMDLALRTSFFREADTQSPFRILPDSVFTGIELDVQFRQPALELTPVGDIVLRTNVSTRLYPLRAERTNDLFREHLFQIAGQGTSITIQTAYWLPEEAKGDDCRCPLLRFVESRIAGFTTEPLVLRGYWSQTFEDTHSNTGLRLIFEPRLESGLSAQQMQELADANIAVIFMSGPHLSLLGLDGTARRFSDE